MAGAIGSIGANSGISSMNSQDTTLKELLARLKALGVDTANIKTVSEAQAALQRADAAQKSGHAGSKQGHADPIKEQASSLAAKMGVSVASSDDMNAILSKISSKISVLKTQAVGDVKKMQDVAQYQSEFNTITAAIASMEAQKQAGNSQLSASMDGMARYNKVLLGL